MITFHVFLKNNLLVTNPKARPGREYDWDREVWTLEHRVGARHERCLPTAPKRAQEGRAWGNTGDLGLSVSALTLRRRQLTQHRSWDRQDLRQFRSLQPGTKAGPSGLCTSAQQRLQVSQPSAPGFLFPLPSPRSRTMRANYPEADKALWGSCLPLRCPSEGEIVRQSG